MVDRADRPQALNEYIKAWCALKVLSKVYGLGDPDGFVFNMSVGYDLEGIKGEKVDTYIESMKDASGTEQFRECLAVLTELFPEEKDFIAGISPRVSCSITLSTLHGCPPDEIERIATYLITQKKVHTFVKCNPTILGYKTARSVLDGMGYDYIVFDEHHFNEDLQWEDAVPMFERLQALADKTGVEFGLKLSNTFPVDTTRGELPGNEMYMSGRSLFPLTIEMCNRISHQFKGKMRISFAGGAEYFNCDKLFDAGIWPITVATTILKPGGYNRLEADVRQARRYALPRLLRHGFRRARGHVRRMPHECAPCQAHQAAAREKVRAARAVARLLHRALQGRLPHRAGHPRIHRAVPQGALRPGAQAHHREERAALHHRHDLRAPLPGQVLPQFLRRVRSDPRHEADRGRKRAMTRSWPPSTRPPREAARRSPSSAAAPTGMAAAYFLGRAGVETTIFERENSLGGIVRHVIPAFRISDEAIDKDVALMRKYNVDVRLGAPAPSVDELKKQGLYAHSAGRRRVEARQA